MRYVAPPQDRKQAENSRWLMDHIIYLPIHSGMSDKDIRLTINRTIDCYVKMCNYLKYPHVPKPHDSRNIELIERAKL